MLVHVPDAQLYTDITYLDAVLKAVELAGDKVSIRSIVNKTVVWCPKTACCGCFCLSYLPARVGNLAASLSHCRREKSVSSLDTNPCHHEAVRAHAQSHVPFKLMTSRILSQSGSWKQFRVCAVSQPCVGELAVRNNGGCGVRLLDSKILLSMFTSCCPCVIASPP